MPRLPPSEFFPPVEEANADGLLALGGSLEPEWLLDAYQQGIFPWPVMDDPAPIAWWSPDPRAIIELDGLHGSGRLQGGPGPPHQTSDLVRSDRGEAPQSRVGSQGGHAAILRTDGPPPPSSRSGPIRRSPSWMLSSQWSRIAAFAAIPPRSTSEGRNLLPRLRFALGIDIMCYRRWGARAARLPAIPECSATSEPAPPAAGIGWCR